MTNENIKAINAEIKALENKRQEEINNNQKIFKKYIEMEGMYGKKVFSSWDCEQGMRGYHYEYPTLEIAEKENEEREQYLKENNWESASTIWGKYETLILPLKEKKCMLKYNMTLTEKKKQDEIKRIEKSIFALEKELEEKKNYLAELKAR